MVSNNEQKINNNKDIKIKSIPTQSQIQKISSNYRRTQQLQKRRNTKQNKIKNSYLSVNSHLHEKVIQGQNYEESEQKNKNIYQKSREKEYRNKQFGKRQTIKSKNNCIQTQPYNYNCPYDHYLPLPYLSPQPQAQPLDKFSQIHSTRRLQYVPYKQKIIEYQQQIITVPVQKIITKHYVIEHITDYVPHVQEYVDGYQIVPEEHIVNKLQYVPVEQKIIHMPIQQGKICGVRRIQQEIGNEPSIITRLEQRNIGQNIDQNRIYTNKKTQKVNPFSDTTKTFQPRNHSQFDSPSKNIYTTSNYNFSKPNQYNVTDQFLLRPYSQVQQNKQRNKLLNKNQINDKQYNASIYSNINNMNNTFGNGQNLNNINYYDKVTFSPQTSFSKIIEKPLISRNYLSPQNKRDNSFSKNIYTHDFRNSQMSFGTVGLSLKNVMAPENHRIVNRGQGQFINSQNSFKSRNKVPITYHVTSGNNLVSQLKNSKRSSRSSSKTKQYLLRQVGL